MNKIIWKAHRLIDIFKRIIPPSTNIVAKELNIFDEPFDGSVALITRAETNNGIRGYIEKGNYPTLTGAITYNDQFSFFLYHNYEFTTIKDHLSVIKALSDNFQKILDKEVKVNIFLTTILNNIYSKEIFNFNFTGADYRFDREIILLPCIEVSEKDNWIWEENGKYFTLAVDYIKKLMDEAKELREQKTIRLYEAEKKKYEAEKKKYEAEKKKYEAEYMKKKKNVVWKAQNMSSIFERSTKSALGESQKSLSIRENKDNEYTIALISASRNGSGRVGYIHLENEDLEKVSKNKLTFDDQWGFTYFQKENFIITGGHNAILEIILPKLKEILDNNLFCYDFLSLIINKITLKSNIFGYGYKINNKFDREIILLPCLEVSEKDNWIWEENGKYWTLATNYISYIYLQGRCNYYQKLIDKWTYQY